MRTLLLSIILSGACLLYLAVLAPGKFGVQYDDSIYVTAAKAMATGRGYKIISLPYEPAQTKYPPFYSLLLSLIWSVSPRFPDNLQWMMLLSVAATVTFLGLTYRYLVMHEYATAPQALVVVAMAAVNTRTAILATTTSSEMAYAALSIAVLYLAEKYDREKRGWVAGAIVGVSIGLACLTRTSGLALLMAVAIYYLVRREWRKAGLPVAVGSLFVLGWAAWCYSNRTAAEGVNVAYYTNYWRDYAEIVQSLQAINHQSTPAIVLGIIARNAIGYTLFSVSVCSGVAYEWMQYFGFVFLLLAAGFIRQATKRLRLLHLYVVSYLGLLLPWPYFSYSRFLIPILPFLLLFLVAEIQMLFSLVRKELSSKSHLAKSASAVFIGLLLLALIGVTLYNYGANLNRSLASSSLRKSSGPPPEDAEAIDWIKANADASDVIICSRDPLYYLYTGRKAARSFPVNFNEAESFQIGRSAVFAQSEAILRILSESNGRYIVLTASDFGYDAELEQTSLNELFKQRPNVFTLVFASGDGYSRIYHIEKPSG